MQWARFYLVHKKKIISTIVMSIFLPWYVDNAEQMIHQNLYE
jgi:hypothetical protein